MSSRKNLLSAVVAKLKADATLVSLLGHTGGTPRIGRDMPPEAGKAPYVGVSILSESPSIPDVPFHKRYLMVWTVTATSDISALEIGDHLETLLDNAVTDSAAFWDFSTSSIVANSVKLRNRGSLLRDEKLDLWQNKLTVVAIANPYKGCS